MLLRLLAAATLAGTVPGVQATGSELGVRYWHSRGEMEWSHCASVACGGSRGPVEIAGTPYAGVGGADTSSKLNYRDTLTHALEIRGRARLGDLAAGAYLGVSSGHSGRFRDQDWLDIPTLGPQFLVADTTSPIRDGKLDYFVADVGRVFALGSSVSVMPLLGVMLYAEDLSARGVQPGPTDFGPGHCGLYGGTDCSAVPESVEVIRNSTEWSGLRLGAELRAELGSGFNLLVNAAWLASRVTYDDSHLLRAELGPTPNIRGKGQGRGSMVDLIVRWKASPRLDLDLGWRAWRFDATRGSVRFGPDFDQPYPARSLFSRRGGALLGVSYRFD